MFPGNSVLVTINNVGRVRRAAAMVCFFIAFVSGSVSALEIISVSPSTAVPGDLVTIQGSGFDTSVDNTLVTVNSLGKRVVLNVLSATTDMLLCEVGGAAEPMVGVLLVTSGQTAHLPVGMTYPVGHGVYEIVSARVFEGNVHSASARPFTISDASEWVIGSESSSSTLLLNLEDENHALASGEEVKSNSVDSMCEAIQDCIVVSRPGYFPLPDSVIGVAVETFYYPNSDKPVSADVRASDRAGILNLAFAQWGLVAAANGSVVGVEFVGVPLLDGAYISQIVFP